MLYQKFCSLTSFSEKIVVIYLVNDLIATGHKTYPGHLSPFLSLAGFSECVRSYLDLMFYGIVRSPSPVPAKLSQLFDLWDVHHL